MKKAYCILYTVIILFCSSYSFAQYPPPVGYPGTTAILKDSSILLGWAKSCSIIRGFLNISDTAFSIDGTNKASVGVDANGAGISDGQVVSLGDGGYATLTFASPVANGTGFDFAVFENGFTNGFLELAFVEVSSDGSHFVRFPSVSLTPTGTQVATFDTIDATKLNNLAGKYRAFYGTPFDLDDLTDSAGIDLVHITHIRIRDVVGTILPAYCTYDSEGHRVNDPFPTPFSSCGFDLDAVGVIHFAPEGIEQQDPLNRVSCYPNPASDKIYISIVNKPATWYALNDITGKILLQKPCDSKNFSLDLAALAGGFYLLSVKFSDGTVISKKILKQ